MSDQSPLDQTPTEKPPFFKSWRGMYALLVVVLIAQVLIYWAITLIYN